MCLAGKKKLTYGWYEGRVESVVRVSEEYARLPDARVSDQEKLEK